MATFGNTNVETSLAANQDYIRGGQFTLSENGSVVKISVYLLDNFGSNNVVGKCAIYDTSGNLLGATNEETYNGVGPFFDRWFDFNFASPLSLNAGNYVIVSWQKFYAMLKYGASGSGNYQNLLYTTNFPNSASFTTDANKYSIYATYTPVASSFNIALV